MGRTINTRNPNHPVNRYHRHKETFRKILTAASNAELVAFLESVGLPDKGRPANIKTLLARYEATYAAKLEEELPGLKFADIWHPDRLAAFLAKHAAEQRAANEKAVDVALTKLTAESGEGESHGAV